jgi:hypothetical protein
VGEVRQAIYDEPIKQEYAQSIRVSLITQLTKRQRSLQEVRALLDDSAPGFLDLGRSRDYKGDAYPGGIPKLDAMLGAYTSPQDLVGDAIKSLKTKYDIQDADLAKQAPGTPGPYLTPRFFRWAISSAGSSEIMASTLASMSMSQSAGVSAVHGTT